MEADRVLALLADASDLVRDVAGRTWIDPETGLLEVVPGSVRWAVLRSTERAVRNPEGYSAESAGDYSFQRTGVQPGIYLTEGEERAIRRSLGKTGLWTQPVTRNEEALHTVWLNDQFGAEPIPYDIYRE
ncbi:MAG TPA: hypothetical protein VD864_17030 [Nocardioides sp.]|nr:hypothetical protein [Nocardioides sp.]